MKRAPEIMEVRRALAHTLPAPSDPAGERSAAVAAILRQRTRGLEVLFIQRAERQGDPWSGHMAFPGGRRDKLDGDLLATAVRETSEEIGVDLAASAELLGVLDDQEATGRTSDASLPTRPFVFELVRDVELRTNHEVTEVVWAPVDWLVNGERHTTVHIDYKGRPYDLPGWDLGGRVVWGLTYKMMSTLLYQVTR